MNKPNVIIRMGAANWDVRVRVPAVKDYVEFNMRKMTGRQRSDFHREFMNAFRQTRVKQ